MKSIAILSALTTVALAQSSASSTSTANPLIPTGISSGCQSFFNALDSDTSLSSCTSTLIAATSQFGPGANSTSTPSTATITSALNNLCSTSASSCTDQTVRSKLTNFYSSCTTELTTNPNSDVLRTYDVLYALTPLQQAVCTKDDNGKYCVTEATTPTSSAAGTNINQYLWSQVSNAKRSTAQITAIIPNTTTFRQSNLLFFFLQPQSDSAILCTTCTRDILMSYINFEQSVPYGPGIKNSLLMSGQTDLYNAVTSTCGKSFLNGGVQAAGGISSGLVGTSAAPRSVSQSFGGFVTAVMGTVAFGFMASL